MTDAQGVTARLEESLARLDAVVDDDTRALVLAVLDAVDDLHRLAIRRLADRLGAASLDALRGSDAAVDWLFSAYGVGVDERRDAEAALEEIRPFLHSHGGDVELVQVEAGVVRVRMTGGCRGCTGADHTLREGVERALRDGLESFVALEVEPDDATPHAPPGPLLPVVAAPEQAVAPPPSRALLPLLAPPVP